MSRAERRAARPKQTPQQRRDEAAEHNAAMERRRARLRHNFVVPSTGGAAPMQAVITANEPPAAPQVSRARLPVRAALLLAVGALHTGGGR
jgi:hypothetical protein